MRLMFTVLQVNGGFSAGTLSTTFSSDVLYSLLGYNGQCLVFYGPLPSPATPPLISDPLSVGGRVFIRLGDPDCTLGGMLYKTVALYINS